MGIDHNSASNSIVYYNYVFGSTNGYAATTTDKRFGDSILMINKKFSIITMVLVVSIIYGISELAPSITVVTGTAQYADRTIEERIDKIKIIVEGKIKDV